jgi:condensation domain-containing protein/tubulysin polyketide synthase-like protein
VTPAVGTRRAAAELLSTIRERGVELWLDGSALRFRAPAGAFDDSLRARVVEVRHALVALLADTPVDRRPLTDRQLRLWLLHQLRGSTPEYHMSAAFRVYGRLDTGRLSEAVGAILARHRALRSAVSDDGARPVFAERPGPPPPLEAVDLEGASDAVAEQAAAEFITRPIDLGTGPLARVAVIRRAENDHVVVVVIHHVVCDDHAVRIVCTEILECYVALADGARPAGWAAGEPLPSRQTTPVGPSLADLAARRGGLLAAVPTSRLPSPTLPADADAGAWPASTIVAKLDATARAHWEQRRQAVAATTLTLTLALTAVAIAAAGGPARMFAGTPYHGREDAEDWRAVDYRAQTIVTSIGTDGAATFGAILDAVKADLGDALQLRDVPYESLTPRAAHSDAGGHVLWVVTYGAQELPQVAGLRVEPLTIDAGFARHDLRVALVDRRDQLELLVTYRRSTVDAAFVTRAATVLKWLLHDVPSRDRPVDELVRQATTREFRPLAGTEPAEQALAAVVRRRRSLRPGMAAPHETRRLIV